jgi:hypothetical protein
MHGLVQHNPILKFSLLESSSIFITFKDGSTQYLST